TPLSTLFPYTTLFRSVGAGEVDVVGAAVREIEHARVLEEAPDDRSHLDVVRQAGDSRLQRAHAAHHQVDLHSRARRRVQLLDDRSEEHTSELQSLAYL